MARSRTPTPLRSKAKKSKPAAAKTPADSLPIETKTVWSRLQYLRKDFLRRRPHRSFRRTYRRDYVRSLALPGYISFTVYVGRMLLAHKKLFGGLLLFYVATGALLIGIASQEAYNQLVAVANQTASDWSMIGQASLLFFGSVAGGLNSSFTEAQQIYSVLLLLILWLAVVYALRAILAGNEPKIRDTLYNSGAPIVSTALVLLVIVVQLIPAGIAVVGMNAALTTGVFDSPAMSLLISFAAAGLGLLSVYWVISSIFALIIVTLPGMHPWKSIRAAGDLVIGRRVRLLLRLVWMILIGFVFSLIVLVPVIVVDQVVKQAVGALEWVPTVPVLLAIVSALVLIWSAAYMYLLYRKVVEDDASPA